MFQVHGRHQCLRSFSEDAAQAGPLAQHYAGIRAIPVDAISGSVGRRCDLDTDFLPCHRSWGASCWDARYLRVLAAAQTGACLPAIEVYRMGGQYYVLDGHHRVAAARHIGQVSIDAVVIDFCPVGMTARAA